MNDPSGGTDVEPEALVPDELGRRVVDLDPGQDLLVADPAAGILVGRLDELADGVLAVAGHAGRDALRDRRDLAADHETAVVVAGDVALDDEIAAPALGPRAVEGGPDRLVAAEVEMDTAAVVAVERLDDARKADPPGGLDRCFLIVHDGALRDGQPGGVKEPVGQALVARDVHADRGGLRGHRRPDPLLMDALPELDEAVPVEPDVGDVAACRLVEDRLGRRPERRLLGQPDQALHLGHEVDCDGRVVGRDEVVDQGDGDLAGLDPDGLLAELVDHVVLAGDAGAPRLAMADVGAGEVLELERDVLADVAGPRPLAEPGDEPAAPAEAAGVVLEAGQEVDEGVDEARDLVAREILEDAEVDDHPDDRLAGPIVRATQDPGLADREGRLGAGSVGGAVGRASLRSRRALDLGRRLGLA